MTPFGGRCVEDVSRPAAVWRTALQICSAAQRQLCSATVLLTACMEGLVLTQTEHSETIGYSAGVTLVGGNTPVNCFMSGVGWSGQPGTTDPWPFRCCAGIGSTR